MAQSLHARLLSAFIHLRRTHNVRPAESFEHFSSRILKTIVPTVSQPKLFFDLFLELALRQGSGANLWTVNEVLLALGLRVWSEDPEHWDSYQILDKLNPDRANIKKIIRRGNRLIQFLVETARVTSLRRVVERTTQGRLPRELADAIFEDLLNLCNLPHPKDFKIIWHPWPEQRTCGECKGDYDFGDTCARRMKAKWLPDKRQFERYHPLLSAQFHTVACREGTCQSHHVSSQLAFSSQLACHYGGHAWP